MAEPAPVSSSEPTVRVQHAETVPNRDAILEQLSRILASSLFRHSKRCGPLLEYIVRETIDGRAGNLKERVVGVAVFGRKPAYDTNDDPVVRTSAGEVRKRIAQYYHEAGHEGEIRIDLTSGSYVPEFRMPASHPPPARLSASESPAEPSTGDLRAAPLPVPVGAGLFQRRSVLFASALALVGIAAAALALAVNKSESRDPLRAFWAPLLRADSVILAMGESVALAAPPTLGATPKTPSFWETIQADRVGFADAATLARVAGLLRSNGKSIEIRRGGSLTIQELRRVPAVLIGALNNPWTSRLEEHLRFRFVFDNGRAVTYLHDQQHPAQRLWEIGRDAPYFALKEDRAIISRFVDWRTEQVVLLLAGFGRDGTTAAGEFVTEPKYLGPLVSQAPSGWSGKNLQVVIATDLINGSCGPPRIVATYFW